MSPEETKTAEATEEATESKSSVATEVDEKEEVSATSEEGKTEPEEEAGEEEGKEGKPKKEGGYQRRIRKLVAAREAAAADAEYWRQQALRSTAPTEPKVEAKAKPKIEDFAFDDGTYNHAAFTEALADWKAEEKFRELSAQQEAKAREEQARTEDQKQAREFMNREQTFAASVEDYDEVADAALGTLAELSGPGTRSVSQAIVASEHGPELLYYLGQNPEEAQRIANLSPTRAVMALGRLETQLAKQEDENPDKEGTTQPPVSRAPKPISPVKKPAAAPAFDPNDEKQALTMTPEEWAKRRRSQLQRRK